MPDIQHKYFNGGGPRYSIYTTKLDIPPQKAWYKRGPYIKAALYTIYARRSCTDFVKLHAPYCTLHMFYAMWIVALFWRLLHAHPALYQIWTENSGFIHHLEKSMNSVISLNIYLESPLDMFKFEKTLWIFRFLKLGESFGRYDLVRTLHVVS